MIYGDLKPQNVLTVASAGVTLCKISDFGLKRYLAAAWSGPRPPPAGSFEYMSPEQMDGKPLTPACDIYAFGGLIYFMVTGRHPWSGLTAREISTAVMAVSSGSILSHPKLPPLSQAEVKGLPTGLCELLNDCLLLDSSKRPTLMAVWSRIHAISFAVDPDLYQRDEFQGMTEHRDAVMMW